MRRDVDLKRIVPVRVYRGPHGCLQLVQGCTLNIAHGWRISPNAGVGTQNVQVSLAFLQFFCHRCNTFFRAEITSKPVIELVLRPASQIS